jgi:hypothetical protein
MVLRSHLQIAVEFFQSGKYLSQLNSKRLGLLTQQFTRYNAAAYSWKYGR